VAQFRAKVDIAAKGQLGAKNRRAGELRAVGRRGLSLIYGTEPQMARGLAVSEKRKAPLRLPGGDMVEARAGIQEIVDRYRADLNDPAIYFFPAIPKELLRNAIDSYAPDVQEQEALVLLDDTFRKNGRDGGLITASHLYAHNLWEKPKSIAFADVESVSYSDRTSSRGLFINGKLFLVMSQPNRSLIPLFTEMVELVCRRARGEEVSVELARAQVEHAVDYVDYGRAFGVRLSVPPQRYPAATLYQPREVLQSACQLYEDYLLINVAQYGKTKYVSYLFGALGAFVLSPLFGSLSPGYKSFRIPWAQVVEVRYFPAEEIIAVHCRPDGESRQYVFAFQCQEADRLLDNLTAFVPVEGHASQTELSRTFTDQALRRELRSRVVAISKWARKQGTLPSKTLIASLSNDLGVNTERVSENLHYLYEHDEEFKKLVYQPGQPDLLPLSLVDELSQLQGPASLGFCRQLVNALLGELRKQPRQDRIARIVVAVIALGVATAMIFLKASWQTWIAFVVILGAVGLIAALFAAAHRKKTERLLEIERRLEKRDS
jgi:hypothetical protein